MINSKRNKFIIAIAIQTAILFFIILFKLLILSGGEEVFLKIRPVDPRDPFRGDYITFQYDISRIKGSLFDSSEKIKYGDKIYIPLLKRKNYHVATNRISKNKPDTGIFIKGAVNDIRQKGDSLDEVFVSYGIEEYFIPENSGRNVNFNGQNTFAKVVLDKNGNAVLKNVYVNGKLWPPKDTPKKSIEKPLSSDDEDFGIMILEENDDEPEVNLREEKISSLDKIVDPSGLYQFAKIDGWRIRSSVVTPGNVPLGGQVSQLILETEDFRSHMVNNDGFSRKKYDSGATLNITVIKGNREIDHGNANIFETSKFNFRGGVDGEYHRFSEPTFLGQLRDVHINRQSNYYVIRFAYDTESYPEGEKVFKQLLDSFTLTNN